MALEANLSSDRSAPQPMEIARTGDKLQVLFRNTGETKTAFVVGGLTGLGSIYTIDFISTRPDGTTCKLLNTTVTGVAGAFVPVILRLEPGSVDSITIDLHKLICTANGNSSADQLLRLGHSIRATFSATAEGNNWGRVWNGWTGQISSGSLAINSSRR
jgi:hypothetical protein